MGHPSHPRKSLLGEQGGWECVICEARRSKGRDSGEGSAWRTSVREDGAEKGPADGSKVSAAG